MRGCVNYGCPWGLFWIEREFCVGLGEEDIEL